MRIVGFCIRVVILGLLAAAERAVGMPVLFLLCTFLWWQRFRGAMHMGWLVIAASLLMGLFSLGWTVSMALIGGGFVWLKHGRTILPSDTVRLLITLIISSIAVVRFGPGQVSSALAALYLLVTIVVVLFVIKSERFKPIRQRSAHE